LAFGLVVLAWVSLWQHQAIADWVKLHSYQPPSQIAQLARQTTMTPAAQHFFYINHPQIDAASKFNSQCDAREQSIVLGCYRGGESGIFILKVTNHKELNGVMQVTAAHEMLHAAYDRLSDTERNRVDQELQNFYQNGHVSNAIKTEMAAYKRTEPNQVVNEMHSVFGTEIADLPPALEQYYSRYFSDRHKVTADAAHYQAAFRDRRAQIDQLTGQLNTLKSQIDANEATLHQQSTQLDQRRQQLEGEKHNPRQYNSDAREYTSQVQTFNDLLAKTKQQIGQYNGLVKQLNKLVLEEQQLVRQLSGQSLPSEQ
jgi:hypothetical protein